MKALTGKDKITSFLLDDKYRLYRHLLLQIVVLSITIGVFFDAPDRPNFSLNRFFGWVGYFLFINMLVYFNAYVLYPRFLAKNKIVLYVASTVIFTLFALFVMMILQEYFYDIAVVHQETTTAIVVLSSVSSLLTLFLFIGGISSVLLLKSRIMTGLRIGELGLATSRSELVFLKSQINPHFLFNMLNNANILVEDDPDTASYILIKLDELLRYQLNDSLRDKVYLNDDIQFLTNFLELEKTRRDKFDYRIRKKGDMEHIQVAPLLFIPFVENAVKHNSSDTENSYVRLSFELTGNELIFICKNSASGDPVKKKDGGLGLTNIRRRLDLLFDTGYSLEQSKTDTEYSVYLHLKL